MIMCHYQWENQLEKFHLTSLCKSDALKALKDGCGLSPKSTQDGCN